MTTYTDEDRWEDEQILRHAEEALPGAEALLKSVRRRVDDLRYSIQYAKSRLAANPEEATTSRGDDR